MVHVYGGPPVPLPCSGHGDDPGRRVSDGILAHQLQPLVVEPTPPKRSLPAGRVVSGQMSLTDSWAGGFSAANPLQVYCTCTGTIYMHACVHVHVYMHRCTSIIPYFLKQNGKLKNNFKSHFCSIRSG